jgi:hypothetical protein
MGYSVGVYKGFLVGAEVGFKDGERDTLVEWTFLATIF